MRVIAYIIILVLVAGMISSCGSKQPPTVTVNGQQLTPIKLDKDGGFVIPVVDNNARSHEPLATSLLNVGYAWPKDAEELAFQTSWDTGGELSTCHISDCTVYVGANEQVFASEGFTQVYSFETLSRSWERQWITSFQVTYAGEDPIEIPRVDKSYITLEEAQQDDKLQDGEQLFMTLEQAVSWSDDISGGEAQYMHHIIEYLMLVYKPPTGNYVFLILLFDEQDVKDAW